MPHSHGVQGMHTGVCCVSTGCIAVAGASLSARARHGATLAAAVLFPAWIACFCVYLDGERACCWRPSQPGAIVCKRQPVRTCGRSRAALAGPLCHAVTAAQVCVQQHSKAGVLLTAVNGTVRVLLRGGCCRHASLCSHLRVASSLQTHNVVVEDEFAWLHAQTRPHRDRIAFRPLMPVRCSCRSCLERL
jgi:hypothetical protein